MLMLLLIVRLCCGPAGSPCALALVPLAYACAIAAITARGILVKSGSAIDALAACKTIALDKTGTITTGSLNLAEGFVISADAPQATSSSSSSRAGGAEDPAHVRVMQGLAELCRNVAGSSSSSDDKGASLGTTTAFGGQHSSSSGGVTAFDSDDYIGSLDEGQAGPGQAAAAAAGFDAYALKCAVALSRLSNHPVSRAMVESAPHLDGDVSVLSFEQVNMDVTGYIMSVTLQHEHTYGGVLYADLTESFGPHVFFLAICPWLAAASRYPEAAHKPFGPKELP